MKKLFLIKFGFEIFNSYDEASAQSAFQKMEEELTGNYEVLQGGDGSEKTAVFTGAVNGV